MSNDANALRDEVLRQMQSPAATIRRQAVARAAELAQQPALREEMRGVLLAAARNDPDNDVRANAQQALDALPGAGGAFLRDDSQHMFGARCPNPKCGHVTYLDKRTMCAPSGTGVRAMRGGLDVIIVTCEKCGHKFEVDVNCEGYK